MMKRVFCAALFLLLSSATVHAACTGSATVWSCPAGASSADVQNAINGATDGAVITFASGAYTWSSLVGLSNSKGATLICASVGTCAVSVTGGPVLGMGSLTAGTNAHLYRISGFTFTQSAGNFVLWFGANCPCSGYSIYTQMRIDHNTFNLVSGGVAVFFGENSTVANFYGVIDHNKVLSLSSAMLVQMIGATNNSPPVSPLGTVNNMFVEDNIITITTMTDAGQGCTDGWGGDAIVWRHNTTTNCLVTSHGVTHAGGPQNFELYNNILIAGSGATGFLDGYRLFHHQGSGEFVAFNNTFTPFSGKSGEALSMLHYRDYANSIDGGLPPCDGTQNIDGNRPGTNGYPCWRQPGRDFAGNLKPMYVWNNFWSGTLAQVSMMAVDLGGAPDYSPQHMRANREWYNAVSASVQSNPTTPFNGTTGMGFGTLANRPTTCTTNTLESGGGVGYFATDQGAQGTLYQCSATNTWTVFYTPYTYPHPLVSGNGSGAVPQPPTNL